MLNSAFHAQGSRVIIVVVQVGAVKIYVAAVEALRKKERQDETQFTTKFGEKANLGCKIFISFPVKHLCPVMLKLAILGP